MHVIKISNVLLMRNRYYKSLDGLIKILSKYNVLITKFKSLISFLRHIMVVVLKLNSIKTESFNKSNIINCGNNERIMTMQYLGFVVNGTCRCIVYYHKNEFYKLYINI